MTCPKCHGLLVPETVHDGALSEDLLRCVNCGRMAKEGEMQKFIDESHRQRWMQGQRLAREAKKKQAERASAPPCTSVVQATKPAKPASPVIDGEVVLGGVSLDQAIDRLRDELDVLIDAKRILERHEK